MFWFVWDCFSGLLGWSDWLVCRRGCLSNLLSCY